MNYEKDIQTGKNTNNQGHRLMSVTESVANKEDSDFFSYVSKRTEKIVTALYMVTDLMDITEPIRDTLRKSAVALLGEAHAGRSISRMSLTAESIISFMKISSSIGLISEMNQGILEREISAVISLLLAHEEEKSNRHKNTIFGENFFDIPEQIQAPNFAFGLSNGQVKDSQKNIKDMNKNQNFLSSRVEKNNSQKPKEKDSSKDSQGQRDSRRSEIINIIKEKKSVTVKDISAVISGVSEKTLQRELVSLVTGGVLGKVGEKRWSKYSLI